MPYWSGPLPNRCGCGIGLGESVPAGRLRCSGGEVGPAVKQIDDIVLRRKLLSQGGDSRPMWGVGGRGGGLGGASGDFLYDREGGC